MKFVANCGQQKPTAEFGVKIDHDGDPCLFVRYNEYEVKLLYLSTRHSCKVYRHPIGIHDYREVMLDIGATNFIPENEYEI